jgi:hypothetical protein
MPRVRGQTVLNTIRFVKERHGAAAHERVLALLPAEVAATFLAQLRDASWKPLAHTVAYMETAQRLLAPQDAGWHRELGRFSGRATSQSGFRFLLGSSPLQAMTRSAFIWRFLYDSGRVEVTSSGPGAIVLRIHDFRPGSRAWCQRIEGFLEAVLGLTEARAPAIAETACIFCGAAYCEMSASWTPD